MHCIGCIGMGAGSVGRSICNALKFFEDHMYNQLCATLKRACIAQVQQPNGARKDKAELVLAMFTHTNTMLEEAYMPKPEARDVTRLVHTCAMS